MTMDAVPNRSADELLMHAGFLRRLAQSVVGRDDQADDVVQEVWVSALVSPPRASWEPRRWLAGVLRNLTRQARRETARRTRRERAVVRADSAPAAADTAAQLEVCQRVVAAVQALADPYRQVIMLRFFDALPPREIARRLQLPIETVHTRQRRALEHMRARLDAEHGGARRAWTSALLPAAISPPTSTVVATGVLMTLQTKVVGALFVIVLVLSLTYVAWPTDGNAEPSRPTALERTAVVAATDARDREPATTQAARTAVAAAPALEVHGRVLRGDGTPYPSARVDVALWRDYECVGFPSERSEVVADREGWFVWATPRPERAVSLALSCGLEDRELRAKHELLVLPNDADPVPITLTCYALGHRIVGSVRDANGAPIAGATVAAYRQRTTTSDDGTYALRTLSVFPSLAVRAFAPGFVIAEHTLRLEPGRDQRFDIELRRGMQVSGRVTAEDDAPIAGALLSPYWNSEQREGRTDVDGRYALTCIDPDRTTRLRVTHPEFVDATFSVEGSDAALVRDVVLRRGVTLRGLVVDEHGTPLPGASLCVFAGDMNGSGERTTFARDDGRFALLGLSPGDKYLVTTRTGFAADTRVLVLNENPAVHDGVRVVLTAGGEVCGTVVAARRAPLAGVSIRAVGGRNPHNGPSVADAVRTDAAGRFALRGLPSGPVTLVADMRGWLGANHVVEATPRGDVVITMERAGGMAGTVVDDATGAPVTTFTIRLVNAQQQEGDLAGDGYGATWSTPGHTFSSPAGVWDTAGEALRPRAVYGIEVAAAGYAPVILPRVAVTVDPDPARLVTRLRPGTSLLGHLVDAMSGAPVVGASVRLLAGTTSLREEAIADTTTTTDAHGAFALPRVPEGALRIAVLHPDWPLHVDGPFAERGARTIRLEVGGCVEGMVLDHLGDAVAGAAVALAPKERTANAADYRCKADAQGAFAFAHVVPGDYDLTWFEYRGNTGISRLAYDVRVARGVTEVATMRPDQDGQMVSGMLIGAEPPADAIAHLIPTVAVPRDERASLRRRPGHSAYADGRRFTFHGVRPGKYTLVVAGSHAQDQTARGVATIEVAAGRDLTVDVAMHDGR